MKEKIKKEIEISGEELKKKFKIKGNIGTLYTFRRYEGSEFKDILVIELVD